MKAITEPIFGTSKATINVSLKSHADDPFVVKKTQEAKRILENIKEKL